MGWHGWVMGKEWWRVGSKNRFLHVETKKSSALSAYSVQSGEEEDLTISSTSLCASSSDFLICSYDQVCENLVLLHVDDRLERDITGVSYGIGIGGRINWDQGIRRGIHTRLCRSSSIELIDLEHVHTPS